MQPIYSISYLLISVLTDQLVLEEEYQNAKRVYYNLQVALTLMTTFEADETELKISKSVGQEQSRNHLHLNKNDLFSP